MTRKQTDEIIFMLREQACEASLQHGKWGVVEIYDADGYVTFGLHPSVPYGEIHEYPWGVEGHPSIRGGAS